MVFSASGLLAALRTIVLFSWQVAHRSVMGFMTVNLVASERETYK